MQKYLPTIQKYLPTIRSDSLENLSASSGDIFVAAEKRKAASDGMWRFLGFMAVSG